MRHLLSGLWQPLDHLFFPRLCEACGDELLGNEHLLCIRCWTALPETGFWRQAGNPALMLFHGRVPVCRAACMYYFHTGSRLQHVLHGLKYRGITELGTELGRRFGRRLHEAGWAQQDALLLPVPLSERRLKERGYNQSRFIAEGLSAETGIPLCADVVHRVRHTATQTRKSRLERLLNMQQAFRVSEPAALEGRHLVLVDDVLTTGATLEALSLSLLAVCRVELSVVTLAYAIP